MAAQLTKGDLAKVVQEHLDQKLKDDELWRTTTDKLPRQRYEYDDAEEFVGIAASMLFSRKYGPWVGVTEKFITDKGLPIKSGTSLFRILCRELIKAEQKAARILMKRIVGNYENEELGWWFPDDLTQVSGLTESPIFSTLKDIGRPKAQWDVMENELLRMEADGEITDFTRGWKTNIARKLFDFYKTIPDPKVEITTPKTISDKDIIKAHLNRIQKRDKL